jgi:hypothetical protein
MGCLISHKRYLFYNIKNVTDIINNKYIKIISNIQGNYIMISLNKILLNFYLYHLIKDNSFLIFLQKL